MSLRRKVIHRVSRCTLKEACDFHKDGGSLDERCPYYCDVPGCEGAAVYEISPEHSICIIDAVKAWQILKREGAKGKAK